MTTFLEFVRLREIVHNMPSMARMMDRTLREKIDYDWDVDVEEELNNISSYCRVPLEDIRIFHEWFMKEVPMKVVVFRSAKKHEFGFRVNEEQLPKGAVIIALFTQKGVTFTPHYRIIGDNEKELKLILQESLFRFRQWNLAYSDLMRRGTIQFDD
jgi:hypothetical protein